jgi:Xaa-Pro dipeptidase
MADTRVAASPHRPTGGASNRQWSGLPAKLADLADIAQDAGLHTLVLRAPATLSWLTGARWNVPNTLDSSCFDIIVEHCDSTTPTLRVVTNSIEAPRLADTELLGLPCEWTVVNWWENRAERLPTGPGVGADTPTAGLSNLTTAITQLRRSLDAPQVRQLRSLGSAAAAATTEVAVGLSPDMTEFAAAGAYAAELLSRGMEPVCLFVAGGTRMGSHRHPLPTGTRLGYRANLVCCARRDGLIVSVTRIVCFTPPTPAERGRYRALLDVEAAFLDATWAGQRLGDIVGAGIRAYSANGFDTAEWTRHHQGGLSGWQPREFPAHPGSDVVVPDRSVVAWNPSGDTWKVEDTCLVTATGVEPVVTDEATAGAGGNRWPMVDVAGRSRPDLLLY